MALFAIGDTHLSFAVNKPMDKFGYIWENHHEKLKENWLKKITEQDTILIVGDISWAMNLEEAKPDLDWMSSLPGRKILIRGNHDYWWTSVGKLNQLYQNMYFLQNSFYVYQNYAVCGARGWLCPNRVKFDEHDRKIYEREAHRLQLSLDAAVKAGHDQMIVILHYPPTNDEFAPSLFTELFERYPVKHVIYGHLHGQDDFKMGLQGEQNGVDYHLVSCDYMNFSPKRIL